MRNSNAKSFTKLTHLMREPHALKHLNSVCVNLESLSAQLAPIAVPEVLVKIYITCVNKYKHRPITLRTRPAIQNG